MAKSTTQARPTFSSILDMPASSVEPPRAMPVGQYVFIVQGQPIEGKSRQKQTPFIEFILKANEALDTVDEEALAEWLTGINGTKKRLQDATIKLTFYLTEGAAYRLTDFFTHCGLEVEGNDASLRQLVSETAGCQVIGTVKQRFNDEGTVAFAFIDSTAAVE